MSKIDSYISRNKTKRDSEELQKIFTIKNELANKPEKVAVCDYGFRPDGSKATRTMGEICNKMGLVSQMGEKIFNLVRATKPKVCLELGTGIGISAAYIGAALKLNRNNGKLITIEGDETLADLSYKTILDGMEDGSIYVLDDIRWSAGMRRGWERICHHREVAEFKDLSRLGVCIIERWKSRGRIGID